MAQASTMSYEVVEGWEQLPAGYEHRDVAGVAVDARGPRLPDLPRRAPDHRLRQQGQLPALVGRGRLHLPDARHHASARTGPCTATDDGNHTVRQFTPAGKLLMTLGTLNTPSDTGL